MCAGQSTPECSAGSTPALTGREEWIVSFSSLCFYYKLDAYLKNEQSINNLKQIKGLYYFHRTQNFEDSLSTWHIYGWLPCFTHLYFSHNDVCAKKNKNKNKWKKGKKNPQYGIQSHVTCKCQVLREPEFILETVHILGLTWVLSLILPQQELVTLKPEWKIPGQSY